MCEWSSAAHLFIRESERDGRNVGREDRLRHAFVGNTRDDSAATPLLHFGHVMFKIAGRDMEDPWHVMTRIPRNAAQEVAAKTARCLHQQRNSRNVLSADSARRSMVDRSCMRRHIAETATKRKPTTRKLKSGAPP